MVVLARPTVMRLPATDPPEGPRLWGYRITLAGLRAFRRGLGWRRRVLDPPPCQNALLLVASPVVEGIRVAAVSQADL
jgi:hypothetical protein